MSDPAANSPSINRHISINWYDVIKLLGYLLPAAAVLAMLYLSSVFATRDDLIATQIESKRAVEAVQVQVTPLTPRISNLEEYRAESKQLLKETAVVIGLIQQDISSIKTSQREAERNAERILQKLDSIPSR